MCCYGICAEIVYSLGFLFVSQVLGNSTSMAEQTILGGFHCLPETVVVHLDAGGGWIPLNPQSRGVLHVQLPDEGEPLPPYSSTLPMTTVFASDTDQGTLTLATYDYSGVSLAGNIKGESIDATFVHVQVNPLTEGLRRALPVLQGKQRTHFCGSWTSGLTLHEDAVVSGLEAANRILATAGRAPVPIVKRGIPYGPSATGSQDTSMQPATVRLAHLSTRPHVLSDAVAEATQIHGSAVETACRILIEVTGSTVDPSSKFESLGLTSMQVVQFHDKLSEALGEEEIPMVGLMTAEGRVDEVMGKLGLGSPAPEDEVATSAVPGHIEQILIAVEDGLEFSVLAAGPMDGDCVILLHGFPETSRMWLYQLEVLGRAGYRVVAPDQRGYSTGARPVGVEAYKMPLLCDDVLRIANALGATRFHLVGHDWGGAVAWHLAASHAERLLSLIVLSTPHLAALAAALDDPLTGQTVASSYMRDLMRADSHETLLANGGSSLLAMFGLQRVARASKKAYLTVLTQPGALEAACNWHRANNPLDTADGLYEVSAVSVPTTFIWSTGDNAFTRAAG